YVVLAYKPLSNNEEVHYYTYQFDGKKAKRIDNFDTKQYIESHDADYKEENMN
ncbi:cystatin-like fold lipoprotein, partial [Staphylococcus epidermidis]